MNAKQRNTIILALLMSLALSCSGPGKLFGPTLTPTPTPTPMPTSTPIPTPTSTPVPVVTGDWEASIAFNINNQTGLVLLSFTVGENGAQIDPWSLADLVAGQVAFGGSAAITAGTFKIENNSVGNTNIRHIIEGTFVTPDKVEGTYEFSYGSMGTYKGDWEGSPKK